LSQEWHPSRLLEIRGTDYRTVYLRNRAELFPSLPYFTLSHCWGSLKPMKLTTETEGILRAGISVHSLPKTFRDAIFITSDFSTPYLWIDSLCIFQDNLEDWQREAAAMCDVYNHALCNIAATGASDGSVGLFVQRDPTVECLSRIYADWHVTRRDPYDYNAPKPTLHFPGTYELCLCDQWEKDLEDGPLNHRAWVMQERFLSTRVLHFSASQVFWECLEKRSGEIFPNGVPELARPAWYLDAHELKRVFFQTKRGDKWEENLYTSWQAFVKAYSRCGLSKDSDKLVAMNGVGQLLSRVTGWKIVSGLWQERLIQELCWLRDHINHKQKFVAFSLQEWRAPTWSWASTNVQTHQSNMRHHTSCSNFQYKASIEAVDIDTLGSGQLKHASLKLRGKLVHATFVIRDMLCNGHRNLDFICGSSKITGMLKSEVDIEFSLDNLAAEYNYQDLVCLGMFSCCCPGSKEKGIIRYLEALVLRPYIDVKGQQNLDSRTGNSGESIQEYERVGMVKIPDSAYDFYISNESDAEHTFVIV
jgi:heterokaryon incompatibility protein (HET)